LAYLQRRGEHIKITILTAKLRGMPERIQRRFLAVVELVIVSCLLVALIWLFRRFSSVGIMSGQEFDLRLDLMVAIMATGVGLLLLETLAQAVRAFAAIGPIRPASTAGSEFL